MYKKPSNLGCFTQNLRTRANLSTKARRLMPESSLCLTVSLYTYNEALMLPGIYHSYLCMPQATSNIYDKLLLHADYHNISN